MTLTELLLEYYEQEMNRVFDSSAGYKMDSPKRGHETEWQDAKERSDLLRIELENRGCTV